LILLPCFEKPERTEIVIAGVREAALAQPTLFVMEGGYAVAEIGVNTVNVLPGFEGG
jgi:acetoin utilization deacetylase AcuC-like enzyme